jgi:hypothetical protein
MLLKRLLFSLIGVALLGGGFAVGRLSVDTSGAYADGRSAGLAEGSAEGLRTGRALQVPPSARPAFDTGYAEGANDALGGFDGGWEAGLPYIVVVAQGSGDIAYRIVSRTPMQAGIAYSLCAQSHAVCRT